MKELSIEEKAKAYDKALEKAREYYKDCKQRGNLWFVEDMEDMFPELKESEGERIRKDIITHFKAEQIRIKDSKRYNSWIIWLEKQGEPTEINPSEFDSQLNRLLKQFESLSKEELAGSLSFYLNVVQNDGIYKSDEKQGEQNPTDEVEPKFKVGDWIVSKFDGKTRQISEVHCDEYNNYYVVKGNEYNIEEYDRLHHLWTIQDANDGDVLKEDSCIFIIEKMNPNRTAIVHCCLFDDGEFDLTGSTLGFDVDSTHPATKEQRDLLFSKMREAGYEWDTEKKELKKIVHKLYPETIDKAIELYYYSYGNGKGGFDNLSLDKFKDIVKTFIDDYGVQSPAWGEKDEKILQAIWHSVDKECLDKNGVDTETAFHWLESIKNRIQPQQEWSEEDIRLLDNCIGLIEDIDCTKEEQNWLKSLKDRVLPQSAEWSEEDEEMHRKCICAMRASACGFPEEEKFVEQVNNWINFLKSQRQWKPSDEQIKALGIAIHCGIQLGTWEEDSLKLLTEQLKKLKG